jgi:septal ring factor EnvC (AmiA/AmiB activator)
VKLHMSYTLGEAAKATGKSKATIGRAVQSGRISAVKNETTGAWKIDPAELHRVFPPVSAGQAQNGELRQSETPSETAVLQLEQERHERERERIQLQARIDDLTRRLDDSEKERRTVQTQLTALLTDQREDAAVPAAVKVRPVVMQPPAKEAGWLRRMMGGR